MRIFEDLDTARPSDFDHSECEPEQRGRPQVSVHNLVAIKDRVYVADDTSGLHVLRVTR
jgi:hypothetical protein